MRLLSGFLLIFLASSQVACTAQNSKPDKRPNIIVIMTDDQGYGEVGFHGNKDINTPNLDKFAADNTEMINFYVSSMCSPTRAGFMTGRYPYRTGIRDTWNGGSLMKSSETTIAEVFQSNGYRTAIFGKWHLGENYPMRAEDQGFEHWLIHGGGGFAQLPDYPQNHRQNRPKNRSSYWEPVLNCNGKLKTYKGYCTDIFIDEMNKYINSDDKPFFAFLSLNIPHAPFDVDDKWSKPYRDKGLDSKGKGPWDHHTAAIYGMISQFDDAFPRILKNLDKQGLRENTIIIFMSDNGPNSVYYTAGLKDRKGYPSENGIRTPFIISWPQGLKGGRKINTMATHLDLLPTLAAACSIKTDHLPLDGINILPLVNGEVTEKNWPDRLLFSQQHRGDKPELYRSFMVRNNTYKLVQKNGSSNVPGMDNPKFELYNMKKDPLEDRDIAAQHPQIVSELKKEYEKWFYDVTADMKSRNYLPPAIFIGTKHENPTRITGQDWNGPDRSTWDVSSYGFWVLDNRDAAKKYTCTGVISKGLQNKEATITLKIGPKTYKKKFKALPQKVVFDQMSFPAGKLHYQAIINMANGNKFGINDWSISY